MRFDFELNYMTKPKSDVKNEEFSIRDQKIKTLEGTVSDIRERFGEGSIMKLGDVRRVDVDVIPTGSIALDLALGVNGVPRGRVIELFGPESSGKTTLALHIVAEAQKGGGLAAYIDAEHALDPEYAKKIGVKIDDLLISQPDNGEQALDIVESLVHSGSVDVIVIDSVAALTPRSEIEGEMGDQSIGVQARLMSRALRKLAGAISRTKTVVIFVNQIRMQIGMMYGNPETTPGGKALKFYSSVRIDVRRIAQVKKGEEIIGSRVRATIVKNKVAAPFKIAEFDIMYYEGISRVGDLINTSIKYGVVSKNGASYSYDGQKLGVGIDTAKETLRKDSKLAKEIEKKLRVAMAIPVQ